MNNLNKYFDSNYYLNTNLDVKNSIFKNCSINHFKYYGSNELREPCDLTFFDWIQYSKQYKIEINNVKNHFIKYGIFKNFTLHKIEIVKNLIKFESINYKNDVNNNKIFLDLDFYKNYNTDLKHLSDNELINHFMIDGYNENRLFCSPIKEFDYNIYLENNRDININNYENETDLKFLCWKHYLYYGYFENKKYSSNFTSKENLIKEDLTKITLNNQQMNIKYKTLVIYVYYNRPGEYKNETNLAFFINETIKKRDSIKDSIEFLFIINNYYTEVNIPNKENIHILKNKNCFDFEAYLTGIKYMEKKYSNEIKKMYEYILFINCSCTGPFIKDSLWIEPFYNKITKTNSAVCSTILTSINNISKISGPQIPGYCFLIKTQYLYLLIEKNSIFKNDKLFSNTVLGYKKNKYDCIISGEHSVSVILLKNNLNISSLCNDSLDYRIDKNKSQLKFSADRNLLFNFSLYTSIFIKNHWRMETGDRDCLPVKWNETKYEIKSKGNLDYINYSNLDFNLLHIKENGIINLNKTKWKSIKEFISIFGDSEEFITFPISKKFNSIDYYYYGNTYVPKYVIEGLKILLNLHYRINFYTKIQNPFNFKIPDSINIKQFNDLNHLNNLSNLSNNDSFLNSNYLFPCREINKFNEDLKNKKYGESIILIDDFKKDREKYINNKYINYLTFYW